MPDPEDPQKKEGPATPEVPKQPESIAEVIAGNEEAQRAAEQSSQDIASQAEAFSKEAENLGAKPEEVAAIKAESEKSQGAIAEEAKKLAGSQPDEKEHFATVDQKQLDELDTTIKNRETTLAMLESTASSPSLIEEAKQHLKEAQDEREQLLGSGRVIVNKNPQSNLTKVTGGWRANTLASEIPNPVVEPQKRAEERRENMENLTDAERAAAEKKHLKEMDRAIRVETARTMHGKELKEGEPYLMPEEAEQAVSSVLADMRANPQEFLELLNAMKPETAEMSAKEKEIRRTIRNENLESMVSRKLDPLMQREGGGSGQALSEQRPKIAAFALFEAAKRYMGEMNARKIELLEKLKDGTQTPAEEQEGALLEQALGAFADLNLKGTTAELEYDNVGNRAGFSDEEIAEATANIPEPAPIELTDAEKQQLAEKGVEVDEQPTTEEESAVEMETGAETERPLDTLRNAYVDALDDIRQKFGNNDRTGRKYGWTRTKAAEAINAVAGTSLGLNAVQSGERLVDAAVKIAMKADGKLSATQALEQAKTTLATGRQDKFGRSRNLLADENKVFEKAVEAKLAYEQERAKEVLGFERELVSEGKDSVEVDRAIFEKFALGEYQAQLQYRQGKLDAERGEPGRVKKFLARTWESYRSLPEGKKLLISIGVGTVAFTGYSLATGGVGPLGLALAIPFRGLRSVVARYAGIYGGKGARAMYERWRGTDRVEQLKTVSEKKVAEVAIPAYNVAHDALEAQVDAAWKIKDAFQRETVLAEIQRKEEEGVFARIEKFEMLETLTQDCAKAVAYDQKTKKRRNIAAVLGGVVAGGGVVYGSQFMDHAIQGIGSTKVVAPENSPKPVVTETPAAKPTATPVETQPGAKPSVEPAPTPKASETPMTETSPSPKPSETPVTETSPSPKPTEVPKTSEVPQTTPKTEIPAEQPKISNAERLEKGLGYEVESGGSIWKSVKEQVKAYVATDQASPEQLGLKNVTPDQFKAFKADIMDGDGHLSPENARILDNIVARSINANHLTNMGIRAPGEIVTWKPNAEGGAITFEHQDQALYDMQTGKPVSVDNLPKDQATGAQVAEPQGTTRVTVPQEQPLRGRITVDQSVRQAVLEQQPAEVEVKPGDEWMAGLTGTQAEIAKPLIAAFEQRTGINLAETFGASRMNVGSFYETVPADVPLGKPYTLNLETPDGPKSITVPDEFKLIRKQIVPTEAEKSMDMGGFVKHRIGQGGKSTLVEQPKPVVETTPQAKIANTQDVRPSYTKPVVQETQTPQTTQSPLPQGRYTRPWTTNSYTRPPQPEVPPTPPVNQPPTQ